MYGDAASAPKDTVPPNDAAIAPKDHDGWDPSCDAVTSRPSHTPRNLAASGTSRSSRPLLAAALGMLFLGVLFCLIAIPLKYWLDYITTWVDNNGVPVADSGIRAGLWEWCVKRPLFEEECSDLDAEFLCRTGGFDISTGEFEHDDSCTDLSRYMATRAFAIMALISGVGAMAGILFALCAGSGASSKAGTFSGIMSFIAALFGIIAMSLYVKLVEDIDDPQYGSAFGMFVTAWLLFIIAGVLCMVPATACA